MKYLVFKKKMSDKIELYWTLRIEMLSRISDHLSDFENQSDELHDSLQTGGVEGQNHVHYLGCASAQDTGMIHTSRIDSCDITYNSDNDMFDNTERGANENCEPEEGINLKICFILKMFVVKQMMKVTLISSMKNLSPKSLGSGPQAFRYPTTHF